MERLQKAIASTGYTSRRKAEELILKNQVMVNGKIVNELGYKVEPSDTIVVEGKPLNKVKKVYYLLNKPRGVLSTTKDDRGRKTVVDLIDSDVPIYPVGRLDYDTTGLILLTNDGELTNILMHPSSKIDKEYVAKIPGILYKDQVEILEKGVMIDGRKTARAKVKTRYDKRKDVSMVSIIIHEGRNHQVKKMFEAVSKKVLKLKRERVAFLDLKGLRSGEYRPLTIKEVKKLYQYKK